MQILGSMICIDENELRIPVPWWHRAPLGFETGTQVYVSVTEPQAGRPGDLLVSVLDPNRWDRHITVNCIQADAPGVIEQAFGLVHNWNIALAETVTIEGGRLHYVDVICEPYRRDQEPVPPEEIEELSRALSARFEQAQVSAFRPLNTEIAWSRLGTIENGWVTFPGQLDSESWGDVIRQQLEVLKATDSFDTTRLVFSGDSNARLFRGVVPRRGAVMVSTEHADEPGVLRQLAVALLNAEVNILSCLLKRGGAAPKNAILVAVCEPTPGYAEASVESTIRKALKQLPRSLRTAWEIGRGRTPESVIYSRHPDDVVAHVPSHLRARVIERRAKFQAGKFPVFLSRRFLAAERPRQYAQRVRDVLEELGCVVVEAEVLPGGTRTSMDEVSAAMWAARAGIVLGVEPSGETEVAFSLNLAHEFGFMQGQGKPLLLLVEAPSKVEKELDAWSNLKGITAPRFSKEYALSPDSDLSLGAVVARWLNSVRPTIA